SEAVTDDRHRDDGRTHEDGSRRNRACRKPREAAYPVARRAAIAHAAAKADKRAGGRHQRQIGRHRGPWQRRAREPSCRRRWHAPELIKGSVVTLEKYSDYC